MINVTQTYLPPFEEYTEILRRAWDKKWITNNGELVQELENKLREYLGVKHLFFTNNGTIVLQMALKALDITGEVITTPFSYVATTNAILWENCHPVFADIEPGSYCIDPDRIEEKITPRTQAILATHVYGYACNDEKIRRIAERHGLRVIYDAAHAFGSTIHGRSVLSLGDVSTCSFHATKLFHTVEGGCIVTNDDELAKKLRLYRSFGHIGDDYFDMGINAKNSEFHAAMGLALLPYLPHILERRKALSDLYDRELEGSGVLRPSGSAGLSYNYAYYPVVVDSEDTLLRVRHRLQEEGIYVRRYFFPSLNTLPFLKGTQYCPVAEDIALRVMSLPLYPDLSEDDVRRICSILRSQL